jgi:hypothetical protein
MQCNASCGPSKLGVDDQVLGCRELVPIYERKKIKKSFK